MSSIRWEHFVHGADIGVRGIGTTLAEAFEQAAIAMIAVIASPESILPTNRIEVQCTAPDDELLLADWLNAIVYEMSVNGMLFGAFHVQITGRQLTGHLLGEPVDVCAISLPSK